MTDEADDSYDLSWLVQLPADHLAAIKRLRQLLKHDPDPIDRHFMFCELERRLYRSRDAFASALNDYDEACRQHDAEMDVIRESLLAKFGAVPLLETYTQMVIRQQKAKDWVAAIHWTERALALYGDQAARPEAVKDLTDRLAGYRAKLDGVRPSKPSITKASSATGTETLTCQKCGQQFERQVAPGRKPKFCPSCRGAAA
ncbi:hypothetical protein ACFFHJ_06395 [Planotetraspora thailandica]|uniref:hypothetical protein n=1 Tax=Planotetraspora thailandica TaxID=487172 RepID=UPI00194E0C5C|nr:hypothetical protein [Planotetraspora thailandica]